MRRHAVAIACWFLPVIQALAGEAVWMDSTTGTNQRNGVSHATLTRTFHLPGATMRLVTPPAPEGGGRLIPPEQRTFGDWFLGLDFGRVGNGGWDRWRFLDVTADCGGKTYRAVDLMEPVQAFALDTPAGAVASVAWPPPPGSAAPAAGVFRLTMLKVPAHPRWLFCKAEIAAGADMRTVALFCSPGGTDQPPQRERVVLAREGEFNLAQSSHEIVPRGPGLVLTNRCAQERSACLVVFEQEKAELAALRRTTGAISVSLRLLPGTTSFLFALGHANEMAMPSQELDLFLKETQDSIRTFLDGIEWNMKLDDPEAVAASLMGLFRYQEMLGRPVEPADRVEAERLAGELRAATDLPAAVAARAKIAEFKEGFARRRLEELKSPRPPVDVPGPR